MQITISNVPGLVNLLRDGEKLEDLLKLSPEQILLRWVNHQLEKVGERYSRIMKKKILRLDQVEELKTFMMT